MELRGCRPNQKMKLTRVAPVKDSKSARKSLALFELCERRLRAAYLGR
jgi:hypothetical protein